MANSNAYTSGTPPFEAGQTLSAEAMERLRQADQRSLPSKGIGTYIKQTPNGSVVGVYKQRRTKSTLHPFKCLPGGGLKIRIHPGYVTNIEPANKYVEISLGNGDTRVWMDLDFLNNWPVAGRYAWGGEVPQNQNQQTITKAYLLLFTVTVTDGAIAGISQYATTCYWTSVAVVSGACNPDIRRAVTFNKV